MLTASALLWTLAAAPAAAQQTAFVEEARLLQVIFADSLVGSGDFFGRALALDGSTLVAGAPGSDRGQPDAGIVLIFERGASGWGCSRRSPRATPSQGPSSEPRSR